MHAISDNAVSQQRLAAHSIATYRAGETVLSAASTIGRRPPTYRDTNDTKSSPDDIRPIWTGVMVVLVQTW